ncbi:MAG: hypothetical protein GDA54_01650 [Alphaproteobacteria bacterium GM7ARS4]|nr:hypothetical protein [Alphaproteobacteria bacterium GM7ARS4]
MTTLSRTKTPRYDEETIARCAEHVFAQEEGQCLLAYLRGITIDRVLSPACDDATLRHVEGQRYLVARLIRWSEGRTSSGQTTTKGGLT